MAIMVKAKKLKFISSAPISVVVPCYQAGKTIARAFDSIIRQSLQVSEIILINDGSSDNTLKILHELASKYKPLVSIISFTSNLGVSSARNAGWENASFDYIAFLDADDVWHRNKIKIQYSFLKNNPDCYLVGHQHQIKNKESDKWIYFHSEYHVKKLKKMETLFLTPFSTPSVMLKRDISFRFDPNMRYSEDYLLWLQIILSGLDAYKLNIPLAATFKPNYGAAGLSHNLAKMQNGVFMSYYKIYQQHLISTLTLGVVMSFSYIKYLRRVLMVMLVLIFRPNA